LGPRTAITLRANSLSTSSHQPSLVEVGLYSTARLERYIWAAGSVLASTLSRPVSTCTSIDFAGGRGTREPSVRLAAGQSTGVNRDIKGAEWRDVGIAPRSPTHGHRPRKSDPIERRQYRMDNAPNNADRRSTLPPGKVAAVASRWYSSVEVSSDRSRPSTGDAIFEMSRVNKDIGGEVSSDCKPSTRSKRGAQRDRDPSARPPAVSVPGSPRTSAIGPRGCRVGIVRPRAGATTPGTARHARRRAR